MKGWHRDSYRHSLAGRGMRTSLSVYKKILPPGLVTVGNRDFLRAKERVFSAEAVKSLLRDHPELMSRIKESGIKNIDFVDEDIPGESVRESEILAGVYRPWDNTVTVDLSSPYLRSSGASWHYKQNADMASTVIHELRHAEQKVNPKVAADYLTLQEKKDYLKEKVMGEEAPPDDGYYAIDRIMELDAKRHEDREFEKMYEAFDPDRDIPIAMRSMFASKVDL